MDFFDVVTTQRAMRRLKTDTIPDAVLQKIMDAAICAPSGGNRQNWSFVVVRDPAKRARLGELYREAWGELMKVPYYAGASKEPADSPAGRMLGGAGDHSRLRHARSGRESQSDDRRVDLPGCPEHHAGGARPRYRQLHHDHPPVSRRAGQGATGNSGRRRDSRPDPPRLSSWKIWASAAPAGARGSLRGSLGHAALIPIIEMWPVSSAQAPIRFVPRPRPTPRSSPISSAERSRHSRVRPIRRRAP